MIMLLNSISSYNYNFNYKMFSTDTDNNSILNYLYGYVS